MRKTKTLNIEFADGTQNLPSSIKVKCNVTGNTNANNTCVSFIRLGDT